MNDGTTIVEKQNLPEALELLGAQRELYRRAKSWQLAYLLCGIGMPFVITVVQIVLLLELPQLIVILGETTLFLITLVCRREITARVEKAAAIQQGFDGLVYGIGFDHVFTGDAEIAELSEHDSSRGYVKRPLKGWYRVEIAGLSAPEAIARCQQMNIDCSDELARRFTWTILVLGFTSLAFIIGAAVKMNSDFTSLCFGFTVIESIFEIIVAAKDNASAMHEVRNACQSYDLSSEVNIRRVQDKILEYRRSPLILVPDALYDRLRKRNELRMRCIATAKNHGGK